MTKVFIAGSRQITRLPAEVKARIDTMIDKVFEILVGDANGADKAVRSYLAEKAYPHVLVHCMERPCRNNVGHWPTREVPASKGARGFDFYSTEDRVMADTAEYGLMLWDGKSKGTIDNVVNLSRDGKPVVVYVAPKKQFLTVKAFVRPRASSGLSATSSLKACSTAQFDSHRNRRLRISQPNHESRQASRNRVRRGERRTGCFVGQLHTLR